jgi:predicted aldo/keto reductase-like oxidoreductase
LYFLVLQAHEGHVHSRHHVQNISSNLQLPVSVFYEALCPDSIKFFKEQLERLRTDYIDYYLMHMITDLDLWNKMRGWGIEEWIKEKKQAGQIRQAGFSFHGTQGEFFKVVDAYPWDFCMIQYNYAGKNYQAGWAGLKKAAELMPVMIMEPLLGGKLATSLPKEAEEVFRKADPTLSPAARALNWVWDHPEAILLLSGMNQKSQLDENIKLASKAEPNMLTAAEHEIYREALDIFNAGFKIHCPACNYCMPCPKNINIPEAFAAYNTSYSMGMRSGMHQYVTGMGLASYTPSDIRKCNRCGECERKCPHHLPVIQCLEAVRKRMEPFWFRWGLKIARAFLGRNKKR